MEDNASLTPRQSGIPRPSRLPVRAGAVRPSPSSDTLKISGNSLRIPRLRATPSRDQLTSVQTPSSIREHKIDTPGSIARTPSRQQSSSNLHSSRTIHEDVDPTSPNTIHRMEDRGDIRSDIVASSGEFEIRSRKPRMSLSERTVETLAAIPPSPVVKKRNSSFYNPNSPMRPPSQSNGSRPGTSGTDTSMGPPTSTMPRRPSNADSKSEAIPLHFRASTTSFRSPPIPDSNETPSKSAKAPTRVKSYQNLSRNSTPKQGPTNLGESMHERSPSPMKRTSAAKPVIRTVSGRSLKPRASVGGLFRKPSNQDFDTNDMKKVSPTFSDSSEFSPKSNFSKASSVSSVGNAESGITPRKSSAALRDQIAKAKAAKRAQDLRRESGSLVSDLTADASLSSSGGFDFGLEQDPFNQAILLDGNKGLLRKRVNTARTDGRLNIAAMGLKEIPPEVMDMYNLENVGSGSWAESVDLTRFVAADNELDFLGEDVFPDIDPQAMLDDEDSKGNQFGGLETLDLHGNLLSIVPTGLRRLELLTTLNLSNNKLTNNCFEIISQIKNLRDLKLAGNSLTGELPSELCQLTSLEILDVQRNTLTALPDRFADLLRLRIFNLAENHFTSLPFEILKTLPLSDLSASKNKLAGTLIDLDDVSFPQLHTLDVTSNQLKLLTSGELQLPALYQLSCSANRLSELPNLSSWVSLLTLSANDNNISCIPKGFVDLPKVKNVDFSGNDLTTLDDSIAMMQSLDILRISGNPLREKKFSAMTTEDLKRALKARIAPVIEPVSELLSTADAGAESDASFTTAISPDSPRSPMSSQIDWVVKAGGVLDRSNTKAFSLNPVAMSELARNNIIRTVELHHNSFKEIPISLAFFASSLTSLSLAHNEFTSDSFLKDDLDLPALRELNLSSNTFDTLQPLIQRLHAPHLEKIDISFNRLITLPPLKAHFPALTVVLASNNTIRELTPEAVRGLKVMDCSSNDLNALNARIGLLARESGGSLERLEVAGNRFRVPKYTVLEKGTEAVLTWLRDRIPVGELEALQAATAPVA